MAKAVINKFPGGSVLTDLWLEQRKRLKESLEAENQKRLDDFYDALLNDEVDPLEQNVADAMVDDQDFHALVRACVTDIESEKAAAYAALARAIATGRVPDAWRRHFILALRDISAKELFCLQRSFIARHHRLLPASPSGGPSIDETNFLQEGQPGSMESILMRNLVAKGFVHGGKLSGTGASFIKACMSARDLTPAAIGFQEWSDLRVAIINYEITEPRMDAVADAIAEELRRHRIDSMIFAITRPQGLPRCTHAVVLLGGNLKHLTDNLEHLKRFLRRVPVVAINVASASSLTESGVQVAAVINADGRDAKDVAKTVREVVLERQGGYSADLVLKPPLTP